MIHRAYNRGPLQAEITELVFEPTDDISWGRRVWELKTDLVFRCWSRGYFMRIIIPSGFRTDFASIPVVAMPFIGQADRYMLPALLHDWACVNKWPRWHCNSMLRSAMELTGVPEWRCRVLFWVVWIFGYQSPLSMLWGWLARRRARRVQNGRGG